MNTFACTADDCRSTGRLQPLDQAFPDWYKTVLGPVYSLAKGKTAYFDWICNMIALTDERNYAAFPPLRPDATLFSRPSVNLDEKFASINMLDVSSRKIRFKQYAPSVCEYGHLFNLMWLDADKFNPRSCRPPFSVRTVRL
jgi:hypothetical protein